MRKRLPGTLFLLFTLIMMQSEGQTLNYSWAQKAGGNNTVSGNCTTADANGNVIVAGTFFGSKISFGDITLVKSDSTAASMYVVKYNTDGTVLWARKAATPSMYKETYGYAATSDAEGNIYVSGDLWGDSINFDGNITVLPEPYHNAVFVVKYSPTGDYEWVKFALAGRGAAAVCIDSNGDLLTTGIFNNLVEFDGHIYTIGAGGHFIAKYSNAGNFIWANTTTISGSTYGFAPEWMANALCTDNNRNVYLAGWSGTDTTYFNEDKTIYATNNSSLRNLFITKYNSSGIALWAKGADKTITPGIVALIEAKSIITAGNNLYATGFYNGDGVKFGNNTLEPAAYNEIFLAKFDLDGTNTWAKNMGSEGYDQGNSLLPDADGNIYLAGTTGGRYIQFNNNAVDTLMGGNHAAIFKTDSDGNLITYIHANNIPYYGTSLGNSIAPGVSGNIFMSGNFSAGVAFGNDTLTSTGTWQDMYITKVSQQVNVGLPATVTLQPTLNVYPNPSADYVYIDIQKTNTRTETEIAIYNVKGELVVRRKAGTFPVKINTHTLAAGIYTLVISSDKMIEKRKLVIQR